MIRSLALGVLAALYALPALAGTWSFSFPPNYCYLVNSPNTLGTLAEGQPAVSFPQTAINTGGLECDVPYPYGVTNAFRVHLTYQSAEADAAKKVGWRTWYVVVTPGNDWENAWAFTEGTSMGLSSCYAASYGPNLDEYCYSDVQGYYYNGGIKTLCTDPACRGNHGELMIMRAPSTAVTNDSSNPVKLTRINVTATTSP